MSTTPNRFDNSHLISNREIRIFLSSTFVDLDAERSALIKLFDKIKYDIREREVYLTVVDLRWGVTEEECKEGKVLSVCLNEIENSHPFFIGILGDRYGYAPSEKDLHRNPELLERYPWLNNDVNAGLSITEIEMQYGALRQESDTDAAFFIKESSHHDDNPRLTKLKEKILTQDRFGAYSFKSIDDLCEKVSRAVYRIVDKYFPLSEESSRDSSSQATYINEFTRFYIKNHEAYRVLDSFVENENEQFLVVTGESGIGKTALLTNWIRERTQSSLSVISYFIGDSIIDNSKHKVLGAIHTRLTNLLHETPSLDGASPTKEDVENLLIKAQNTGKRLVLIVDAINQLVEQDRLTLLEWFPTIPRDTKVIFSSLDDDSVSIFERVGYSIFHLKPLREKERNEFIVSYLSLYGKKLNSGQQERILNDPQNANTLILKTLLNELISFGSYLHLDERIDYYLAANTRIEFFDRVIARHEHDFSANQDIVRTVLSLVLLSKDGLSEDEILGITHFRLIDWSLFFCSFYSNFISRRGKLSFSHQIIADAVLQRYSLNLSKHARLYREDIIKFFAASDNIERKTVELSYQYYHLDSLEELHKTVLSFDAFTTLDRNDPWMLACYWRKLLSQDDKYSLEDYLKLRRADDPVIDLPLYSIARFIGNYFPNFAIEMQYYNCYINSEITRNSIFHHNFSLAYEVYEGIASCSARVGQLDFALKVLELLLQYAIKPSDISDILNQIGDIYETKGERERALDYYQKSIAANSKDDHVAQAISYIGIAGVYKNQKNYEAALQYYHKGLELLETYSGNTAAGMGCYLGLGYVYGKLKKKTLAIDYIEKGLSLFSKEYGVNHPSCFLALQYMASVYLNNDDNDNALKVLLRIVDTFENNSRIKAKEWKKVFCDIGELYYLNHDLNNAINYYKKAIELACNHLELEPEMAPVYGKLSSLYYEQQQFERAAEALEKAAEIIGKNDESSKNKIQYYTSAGLLFRAAGRIDKALPNYEKALKAYYIPYLLNPTGGEPPVYEDPEEDPGLSGIYNILKDYPESLERAFLSVTQVIGDTHPFSVLEAYKCIASAYYAKNNYEKALEAVKNIIKAFEDSYSNNYLPYCYACSIAGVLNLALKKNDVALEFFQRALNISEKIGANNPATEKVYYRIGQVYYIMKDYSRALYYYEQAVAQSKDTPNLEAIHSIGLINEILNNKEIAIENYKKVIDLYNGDQWMTSAYIKALSRLGNLYSAREEDFFAFEFFLRGADMYDEQQSAALNEDIVYCCRMAATIAVKYAQEATKTKMGYETALKLLSDSYQYMRKILGETNVETKVVYAMIEVIKKAKYDSLPWYKRLFTKK